MQHKWWNYVYYYKGYESFSIMNGSKNGFFRGMGYKMFSHEDNYGTILLQNYTPIFVQFCYTQWSFNHAYRFDGLRIITIYILK